MTTPTTTFETIRDNQITVIQALTPTAHQRRRFAVEHGEMAFREWAESAPASCFRRFRIEEEATRIPQGACDLTTDTEVATQTITIAYPREMGLSRRDLYDLIRSDREQINGNSGVMANRVSGQHGSILQQQQIDDDPDSPVVFSVLTYETQWYQGVQ